MEFGIYLVLILALASLAGFMLHARFSARRDKALHHAPLSLAAVEVQVSAPEQEIHDVVVEAVEVDNLTPNDLPAVKAESIPVETKEDERKSEYLDELQEAAAGLAMLMRSSAANRATPVVFAPDDEEVDSEEAVDSELLPVDEPAPDEPAPNESVQVESETVPVAEVQVEEVTAPEKKTLEMLLGEEVTSQFVLIDSGLDELESLVGSIESGLAALAPVEDSGIPDEATEAAPEMIEVSEAA